MTYTDNKGQDPLDEEPKIFGISINGGNQKTFHRREFIRSAAIVGTTVVLTGCNLPSMDSSQVTFQDQISEAVDKTLAAKRGQQPAEVETAPEAAAVEQPTSTQAPTDPPAATHTATTAPTQTPTDVPTEAPTNTEAAEALGEVHTSHSIFEGPHTDHPFISKTVVGEVLTILGKTSDGVWYKIRDSEGTIGWCYSEFITLTNNVTIPVARNIPTQPAPPCSCDVHNPCSCDEYSSSSCGCDGDCSCDVIHYWYPN